MYGTNTLGTTTFPQKENKTQVPWVHVATIHWLQDFILFLQTYVFLLVFGLG
jgi:hypothetical protein